MKPVKRHYRDCYNVEARYVNDRGFVLEFSAPKGTAVLHLSWDFIGYTASVLWKAWRRRKQAVADETARIECSLAGKD